MLDPPAETRNPLLIPELFQCILDWLFMPDEEIGAISPSRKSHTDLRKARRALAALARTCRALSEPSLDRLWQQLDSVKPLIRFFPPTSPLSPAEWAIINRYSHRVRELRLHSMVGDDFLQSASSCPQSPFLFPNLRALKWTVTCPDLAVTMHRILSPTLVSLSVTLCRTHRGVDSFLQNYDLLCPGLKSIEFDIREPHLHPGRVSTWEIPKFSRAICTQKHLESLKLSIPIGGAVLRHVMLSPQLRAVSLVLHPLESNLRNISIASADTPFRNVKELELLVWDLQFVFRLLRPKDQMFRAFCLRLSGLHDAKTISTLLTTLASPQRTDSLQSIHFTFDDLSALSEERNNRVWNNAVHHHLTYDILQPLTSFKHLRELVLLLINHTVLNDEELTDLARNWPMLEVLELNGNNGCYVTSITLGGLLSLLTLCLRLHDLKLSIDAMEVPEKTSVDVCKTNIPTLWLPDSPILDARLVADFFSRHIPSVAYIDVTFVPIPPLRPYRPPEMYESLWKKVNNYLRGD